jgi:hypothetical protein
MVHGPRFTAGPSSEERDTMRSVHRVMRNILLVGLCAGAPYGPLLPHHPSTLQYQRWFGRWFPERSGA